MTWREHLFFNIVEDGIGLFDFLLRFGLHDSAQAKAQAIEHFGHGTRRGQLLLALTLFPQRLERRLSRQPRVGQTRSKRRILLRMGVGKLTQRLSHLRMLLFPAFAATESRLRTKTHDPGASLS